MQAFGMHLARLIGSDEVKKVVNEGDWDRPEVLETAQAFEELASKGYFSAQVGSNVWPTGQNTELATGLAAMYCVGTYVVNETKNITGPGLPVGFFRLSGTGKRHQRARGHGHRQSEFCYYE